MDRRTFLKTSALALSMSSYSRLFKRSGKKPDILLIMADDMGFSDIGCYGDEIRTPALDRLAEQGLRFSQFYNTARCCPTRASLLTGLHPHQAGIGWMTHEYGRKEDRPSSSYQGWLNDRCVTIAEVLKQAGYRTYMSGKWHVGTDDTDTWPLGRGLTGTTGSSAGPAISSNRTPRSV
jgi:arylsulfatase A-like enzyme